MIEKPDTRLHDHLGNSHPYRSILALNGDLPDAPFFNQWQLPIIAADGAVNTLLSRQIRPIAVVGDLDSANLEAVGDLPIIHTPDENYSDFSKCLEYMKEQQLLPTIVLGLNGGHIDHIMHNINLFSKTDSIFYAAPIVGRVLKKGTQHFSLPIGTKLSLFGIPDALLSSQGLKWELKEYQAAFPGANSCFNRTVQQDISVTVQTGTCLFLIYLENDILRT
jgi:thiamine pyrophosphokinase